MDKILIKKNYGLFRTGKTIVGLSFVKIRQSIVGGQTKSKKKQFFAFYSKILIKFSKKIKNNSEWLKLKIYSSRNSISILAKPFFLFH